MKIRIFAFAKELDIDSRLLIDYCSLAGITIKNSALASISPEERDRVKEIVRVMPEAELRIALAMRVGSDSLDLSAMKLTSLPDQIKVFQNLKELNLRGNELVEFPEILTRLPNLRKLNLSHNFLRRLPRSIAKLRQLEEIHLDHNQLEEIPVGIAGLNRLRTIDLSHNAISSLEVIYYLWENGFTSDALLDVKISDNKISDIADFKLALFPCLQSLDVSGNMLTAFPDCITKCADLRVVRAARNRIATIPASIGELTNLTHLDLTNNRLTSLTFALRRLHSLREFGVAQNEGLGLPRELVETGADLGLGGSEGLRPLPHPSDILNYYFERRESGGRPLNEVKLLIVGRGASGKTSIVKTMILGEEFRKEQEETPGIAIATWQAIIEGNSVDINVWDFAGQEITHETHRFFLTERSVYLLVLDGRRDAQHDDADYWLSHVEKYGHGSPVIVALNKSASPGPYTIQERQLRRKFPFIRDVIKTDCATGLGLHELRRAILRLIASSEMDDVRTRFPISWFGVKEQIAELRRNGRHFLTFQDYSELCHTAGIEERDPQETLARILHRLGCALYYGDNPRLFDTRVLIPDWVVNGVYALIRGVQKRGNQKPGNGLLPTPAVGAALKAGLCGMSGTAVHYPVNTHPFLLNLMIDRELCFESIGEDAQNSVYLFPELLPDDEPENCDITALCADAVTKLRYCYDFLPDGVIARFIVRTHPLSYMLPRWRYGVVLAWEDSRALIISDRKERRIEVFLIGGSEKSRQRMAGIVRSNLSTIHSQMPGGIKVREELDPTQSGEQWVPVSTLAVLERDRRAYTAIVEDREGIGKTVDIDPTVELEAIEPASARQPDAPRKKVFVSYAHLDVRYQKQFHIILSILKNDGLVQVWYDGELRGGEDWDQVIRHEIEQCDIMVMLLSSAFFASKYIHGVELALARKLRAAGKLKILPVKVEEVSLISPDWLRGMHIVPNRDGKAVPINGFRPQIHGWVRVETALRALIEQ